MGTPFQDRRGASRVHAMHYDNQIKRGSQRDLRLTIKSIEPLKK
jgi:hypothetical protein